MYTILATCITIVIALILYYLSNNQIISAHKETTETLGKHHKQSMETLAKELHGDFGTVMDVIKEDGKQTRLSIDKSTQSTLEVIEKSHTSIKDELKELERPS